MAARAQRQAQTRTGRRRTPRLRYAATSLSLVLSLALTACGGGKDGGGPVKPSGPPAVPAPKADWQDCPLTGQTTRECATLKVPVDAAKPGSGTLDLAVSRLPATDRKRRIGALVMDPGGPGLPGLYTSANLLPPQIRALFDVVGFDRRGSGRSTPVDCGETGAPVRQLAEAEPAGLAEADVPAVTASLDAYVTKCRAKYGELTAHLGTKDVTADLESIRLALGEDKLSLLFLSYGTLLGQEYLRTHPDRVRAAVLDGTVDPDVSGAENALGGSMTLDEANGTKDTSKEQQTASRLRASTAGFRAWCTASGPAECAIAPEPEAALTAVAAKTPELAEAADAVMVVPSDWPGFSRAVDKALEAGTTGTATGTPTPYADLKAYADKGFPKDVAAALKHDPPTTAFHLGNQCTDFAWPHDVAAVLKDITDTAKKLGRPDSAPVNAAEYVGCAVWPRTGTPLGPITTKNPAGPKDAKDPKNATSAPRPLIVNAEKDPRTTLTEAEAVAKRLPASLLKVGGQVHGVTLRGSECVNTALTRTLVDGAGPKDGTCPPV
ncbi:alpha/beta fold hydrolase [Streptomyces sp. NPDC054863]